MMSPLLNSARPASRLHSPPTKQGRAEQSTGQPSTPLDGDGRRLNDLEALPSRRSMPDLVPDLVISLGNHRLRVTSSTTPAEHRMRCLSRGRPKTHGSVRPSPCFEPARCLYNSADAAEPLGADHTPPGALFNVSNRSIVPLFKVSRHTKLPITAVVFGRVLVAGWAATPGPRPTLSISSGHTVQQYDAVGVTPCQAPWAKP